MTLRVIGIICLAIIFILPVSIVKRMARDDETNLNSNLGRVWIFITQITIPFYYLNIFPAWIILGNPRMFNSLKRDFKESDFGHFIWMLHEKCIGLEF